MTTYGSSNEDSRQPLTRKVGHDDQQQSEEEPSLYKKITENRWLNLILFFILVIIVAVSIACVTVVAVLHYHLLFVCGYAEFIFLVALEGCILAFCFYHLFHIFQLFKKRAQSNPVKGPFAWFTNVTNYQDIENYDPQDDDDEYEDDEEEEEEEESRATKIAIFAIKFLGLVLSIVAMIVLLLFTTVAVPLQQSTLPQVKGTITLSSFKVRGTTPPTVTRESNGMVHVEASDDYDAYFAQGFSHAQDRLWQLEFNKRVGAGTLSAIAGKDALNVDKGSRTIGFKRAAQKSLDAISQSSKDIIQAYCDGINAFIDSNPTLAPEFKLLKTKPSKWEPIDVLTWGKVVSWSLSANHNREIIRYKLLQRGITKQRIDELIPLYPSTTTVLNAEELNITLTPKEIEQLEATFQDDSGYYQPEKLNTTASATSGFYTPMETEMLRTAFDTVFINPLSAKASNNWVISGQFTKRGKPFVANDPHLSFTAPGIWHLDHLKSSKTGLDVIGATFVGTPGVVIGRNKHISWGVTNGYADVQDLFALDVVTKDVSYRHNGQTVEYTKYNEEITVKGSKPVTLVVLESVYGPVVNDMFEVQGETPLSLHWVSLLGGDTSFETFIKLNYAQNHQDFVNALKLYIAPAQNFIYADIEGNIAYYLPGKIPIRKVGHSGRYVVPGNGTFDYFTNPANYIPFDKLPNVINPSRGFVSSANNRVAAPGYGYSISQDFRSIYRAIRIEQLILNMTAKGTVDWQDMRNIQYDVKSTMFDDFRFVFKAIAGNVSKEVDTWRAKLEKWDAFEKLYSQEASVFEAWYFEMGSLVKTETGLTSWRDPIFLRNALLNEDPHCMKTFNKTCLAYGAMMLDKAITNLEATYGSIPLWGSDIHQSMFPHEILKNTAVGCLASKSVMNIGGTGTTNVGAIFDAALTTREGVSYRQIVDLANNYGLAASNTTDVSDKFIIPLGQSGNFLSPHYDNFLNKWKDGQYIDMKLAQFERANTLTLKGK